MRSDGAKVYVRLFEPSDASALLDLRKRNAEFLKPWEPRRPVGYTTEAQDAQLQYMVESAALDRSYHFGIFTLDDSLVGSITLANIARGAWQNATVGYFVDESHNNKGYASEAIRLVVLIAFSDIGLHRVQAGVMPRNPASTRALEKAGFRREGMSPRYVQIDGVWEDHVIYAITQEDVTGSAQG